MPSIAYSPQKPICIYLRNNGFSKYNLQAYYIICFIGNVDKKAGFAGLNCSIYLTLAFPVVPVAEVKGEAARKSCNSYNIQGYINI